MSTLASVLGFTLPAIIVFATVYFMLKKYFQSESEKRVYESKRLADNMSFPIKLQAYERLSLYLERIRIHSLMMRLGSSEMDSKTLINTLQIGLHQEYEHNLVQQVYISEKLWEIIQFATKEIMHALQESTSVESSKEFDIMKKYLYDQVIPKTDPIINTALSAIKKEIQSIL